MLAARNAMITPNAGVLKQSYSYAFSGTTKPASIIDVALNANASNVTTVASGVIREGNNAGTTNGFYYTLSLWGVQMATNYYTSSVTNGLLQNTDRAVGPAMSDATGSKVIFTSHPGTSGNATIITVIGGVMTTRFTSSSATYRSSSSTDVLAIIPSVSGGIWTYQAYKNGSALAGMSWTDSLNEFGTPGVYPGGVFRHTYSVGQYGSPGIKAYAAADI